MRWLIRIVLFWCILLPIGLYIFEPKILAYATAEVQKQAHAQCMKQTLGYPRQFPIGRPEIAESYCNCVKSGAIVTRQLLIARVKGERDEAFEQKISGNAEHCSRQLQSRGM